MSRKPLPPGVLAATTHLPHGPVTSDGTYELIYVDGAAYQDDEGQPVQRRLRAGETFPGAPARCRWRLAPKTDD